MFASAREISAPFDMFKSRTIAAFVIAVLGVGLGGRAAIDMLLPTYSASVVLVSEVDISDVGLAFEKRPLARAFQHREADRLFAWDAVVARGTRPTPFVEITWRGPDGHERSVRQVVLHEDGAPRCIQVLRLDGTAEPVSVGVTASGTPLLIESVCR
jgi:hypothetical protein